MSKTASQCALTFIVVVLFFILQEFYLVSKDISRVVHISHISMVSHSWPFTPRILFDFGFRCHPYQSAVDMFGLQFRSVSVDKNITQLDNFKNTAYHTFIHGFVGPTNGCYYGHDSDVLQLSDSECHKRGWIRAWDVAEIVTTHVRSGDRVMLAIDTDGAELYIFERLAESGALRLIHEISVDCHPQPWRTKLETESYLFALFKKKGFQRVNTTSVVVGYMCPLESTWARP